MTFRRLWSYLPTKILSILFFVSFYYFLWKLYNIHKIAKLILLSNVLNGINLMNIGFTELTFSSKWIPLSNGILNVEKFFMSFRTIFRRLVVEAVFVSGVYSVFVSNLKESSISFGEKPLRILYGSIARNCISLYFQKVHWKKMHCHYVLCKSIPHVIFFV